MWNEDPALALLESVYKNLDTIAEKREIPVDGLKHEAAHISRHALLELLLLTDSFCHLVHDKEREKA